ncbi:ketopantoate reductase family protein [Streptomyces phaeoluteigriseus]|uniref:ketopantoate reductase family protein n=1 Tax=Streptomyces phaeoluteigriseus TaxID=114686 RepID=UPI0036A26AE6
MRHAILGAGGVGLALGAALARGGHDVTLVMRESSRARYSGVIDVHSGLRGDHRVAARGVDRLDEQVDVLWVTVKAPALRAALDRVGPRSAPHSVVPLLNGLDHPRLLRERFGLRQLVGAIRIEAERTAPGKVTWNSLFAEVSLAADDGGRAGNHSPHDNGRPGHHTPHDNGRPEADPPHDNERPGAHPPRDGGAPDTAPAGGPSAHPDPRLSALTEALADAGIGCVPERDPASVLWRKLVLLLPLALATTAADGPLGVVRRQPALLSLLRDTAREACAVAAADSVAVDERNLLHTLDTLPGRTDTSLHRDVAAGVRPTELTALTEPVLRRARDQHVAVPAIAELARRAAERELRAQMPAPHGSTYRKGETS